MSEVSIVLPVYNIAAFLPQAIASISRQTLTDFEVVVVDDGSTDETPALLADWARRDPRVRIVRHPENRQVAAALNTGLAHARHRLIVRADGDDTNAPGRLAALAQAAGAHPDHAVIGSAIWRDDGSVERFPATPEAVRARMLWGCPFSHPTVLLNRDVLGDFRYSTDFPRIEDRELWWRTVFRHPTMNLPQPLVHYRYRPGSASNRFDETRRRQERDFDVLAARLLGIEFAPDVGYACRIGGRVTDVSTATMTRHVLESARRAKQLGLSGRAELRREALLRWWLIARHLGRRRLRKEWAGLAVAMLRVLPGLLQL